MIKVAFISRATLYSSPGGDTAQMENTAQELKALGVAVDICLANQSIEYENYDLLHFFNITRPADIIKHIKKSGKPYVVSPIFVDYNLFNGFLSPINLMPSGFKEYVRTIGRSLINGEEITSWEYLLWGHSRSVRYVARSAMYLLPNSESEYRRFVERYKTPGRYMVVPNGINTALITRNIHANAEYENAIICMGRIEPRKNQLALIRALNNTGYRVFIHGTASPNHKSYYDQCVAESSSNVSMRDWISGDELYAVYKAAKVHVLPSYFETTGLSSLEAAVMGCNIVVTPCGDTVEYFGDDAWYCNPADPASIRQAVDKAFSSAPTVRLQEYILNNFTWRHAAIKTLEAYKLALGNRP